MYSQTFGLKLSCIWFWQIEGLDKPFTEVMKCYRLQPQSASHVYRSVLLQSNHPRARIFGSIENRKLSTSRYCFIYANKCLWLRFRLYHLHFYSSALEFPLQKKTLSQRITLSKCWDHNFLLRYQLTPILGGIDVNASWYTCHFSWYCFLLNYPVIS